MVKVTLTTSKEQSLHRLQDSIINVDILLTENNADINSSEDCKEFQNLAFGGKEDTFEMISKSMHALCIFALEIT